MTIELNFGSIDELKFFAFVVNQGLVSISNEDIPECYYSDYIKIGTIMKPIKNALAETYKKEKYLKDYNKYLELKERFEPREE